jgi:hypothetical protein
LAKPGKPGKPSFEQASTLLGFAEDQNKRVKNNYDTAV